MWDSLNLDILVNLSATMPHRVQAIIETEGWYTLKYHVWNKDPVDLAWYKKRGGRRLLKRHCTQEHSDSSPMPTLTL